MKKTITPYQMAQSGTCIGCGSCAAQEIYPGLKMQWNAAGEWKPVSHETSTQPSSALFEKTCPFSPLAANETELAENLFPSARHADPGSGRFQNAWVGAVADEQWRGKGSSGGMVSWVATELLRRKLVDGVVHVVASGNPQAEGRFFHYRVSTTEEQVWEGAQSRYYPLEMSSVIKTILQTPGRFAITGIPCFIKAIQLLRQQYPILQERIRYTLGLFCGHMKSARFAESIAWQLQVPVEEVMQIDYRNKNEHRPANWYNTKLTLKDGATVDKDWWHLVDGDWGAGFFMNHACNFCDDVMAETADVSFGDAWVEPYASDSRGTNVVVARSAEIAQIIHEGMEEKNLELKEVDADFINQTQAAGLRQRREGLSYRLTWAPGKEMVKKRVPPNQNISASRKRIYRMRYRISKWSHRVFALAKKLHTPSIYFTWAKLALSAYYSFAYHKGSLKEFWTRWRGLRH